MTYVNRTPEMEAWVEEVLSRRKPLTVRQRDILVAEARKLARSKAACA